MGSGIFGGFFFGKHVTSKKNIAKGPVATFFENFPVLHFCYNPTQDYNFEGKKRFLTILLKFKKNC